MDDILIYSKDGREHRIHVMLVLIKLRQAGLKIKIAKCEFCKDSVTFLGYRIDKYGISPAE